MNYMGMSKGVWRLALAVLAVLLVLSLPVFGASGFGTLLKSLGMPLGGLVMAPVLLAGAVALLLLQCVFYVFSSALAAILRPLFAFAKKAFLAAFRAVHVAAFQDDLKK